MPDPKYLAEVTLKISEEKDGRFKGHIIAPGSDRMVTVPNKDREQAVKNLLGEARNILKSEDNYRPPIDQVPQTSGAGTGSARKTGS